MRREYATTVGHVHRYDPATRRLLELPSVDAPVLPAGENWTLVAATVDEKFVYWFWERPAEG